MAQIVVIGLGYFGGWLGRELYNKGHDVLGMDRNELIVQHYKDELGQVVQGDATDKEMLLSLGVDKVSVAVVAIGTDMLASIRATFTLKEIGVRRIICKATSDEHGEILSRMGADEVVFPEKDMAVSLARRVDNPNLVEYLPFTDDFGIFEFEPPESFVGKTLRELDLINRYNIQIIAVRGTGGDKASFIPGADLVLEKGQTLVVLGTAKSVGKVRAKSGKNGNGRS